MTAAVVLKPFVVPNKLHLEAIRIRPGLETRPAWVNVHPYLHLPLPGLC